MPVVIRFMPIHSRFYICHAETYANAFGSAVNGFYSRADAETFALEHGCSVARHPFDQLQID